MGAGHYSPPAHYPLVYYHQAQKYAMGQTDQQTDQQTYRAVFCFVFYTMPSQSTKNYLFRTL